MSETAAPGDDERLLEALLIDNPDFAELETHLAGFNLFDAIGMARQELKHSNLLAFLLSPQQNHGLGDEFLKRLFQRALQDSPETNLHISPLDLDLWSLDDAIVLREWHSIDILVVSRAHRLVILIENKIGTGEREGQLNRYHDIVSRHYSGFKTLPVLLAPEKARPSDDRYVPMDYGLVEWVIGDLLKRRASILGPAVKLLLEHYVQMLRRHVLGDSEIATLCRKIYRQHKRALDLIFEHRPDNQGTIGEIVAGLINSDPDVELDSDPKGYVRFIPKLWDVPQLRRGWDWSEKRRILLLEFKTAPDWLQLDLVMGPGDDTLRHQIHQMALSHPDVFTTRKLGKRFQVLYSRPFLTPDFAAGLSDAELRTHIKEEWALFREQDLPRINRAILDQSWPPPPEGEG